MTQPARFRQDDVRRAIAGAKAAGFEPGRVEIARDGRIVIMAAHAAHGESNPWDEVLEHDPPPLAP